MLRVLFIDDETKVLEALQCVLRKHRGDWDMRFLDDPAIALGAVDDFAPDVVVSELQMAGVDGISLMGELARRKSPATRVIMSGEVSSRAFVETLGIANQFLSKPVDRGALEAVIRRAGELKEWLARPEVQASVRECSPLPILPRVYQELIEAVRREASLAEIGEIAAQDPAISARLLQVANSAYFAPRHPIQSARLAASFLGLDLLRPIVLFASMGAQTAVDPLVRRRHERVWRDSLEVAQSARSLAIAEKLPPNDVAAAFSLGILHDIGALALGRRRDPIDAGEAANGSGRSADEVECDSFGVSHCDVGARILNSWGLPDDAVSVAAWHHDARRFAEGAEESPAFLVAAACAFRPPDAGGGESAESSRLRDALVARECEAKFDEWRSLLATSTTTEA